MTSNEIPAKNLGSPASPGNGGGSERPHSDEIGGYHFAYVVEDSPEKRLNLNDLELTFGEGQPDLVTGKRVFGKTIIGLGTALTEYSRVIDGREDALASYIDAENIDPEVLGASDRVHEALFSLRAAHQGYTGHPFLGDPLMRERRASFDAGRDAGEDVGNESGDEVPTGEPGEDPREGPANPELGVCLPLDKLLQSGTGTMVQLSTAKVYGDGVVLGVECALIRGEHEGPDAWERRSNSPRGFIEFSVQAVDPHSGTTYPGSMQHAGRRDFRRVQRLEAELWIPGIIQAHQLDCTLLVRQLFDINGEGRELRLDFDLDPVALREAAERTLRP